MNKSLISILAIALVLGLVIAIPNFVPAINNKGNTQIIIPEHAVEIAPGVFSLGNSIDKKGRLVEGFAFVDYKKKEKNAKPGTVCGNGICEPSENSNKCAEDCSGDGGTTDSNCFAHMAKGAKWKSITGYYIDTTNNPGLGDSFVRDEIASAIEDWESEAGIEIFGNELFGVINHSTIGDLNFKNEIIFGDLSDPNAIAVTIVWGIFRGKPSDREIVEADQVYDDVTFDWSEDCTAEDCVSSGNEKMDFRNIAEHEVGHATGMDHPDITCINETMYASAEDGETKKRDLNSGDISGITSLYA